VLQTATRALLSAAGIDGLWRNAPEHPEQIEGDTWTLRDMSGARHLHGLVQLPSGQAVICGVTAIRELGGGDDWLYVYLPLAALRRLDTRIGAYPFGPDGLPSSLTWRKPLDDWLARLAIEVRRAVSFKLALIGFEVDVDEVLATMSLQKDRRACVVMANGTYLPATC
jgi:hypothetical protein